MCALKWPSSVLRGQPSSYPLLLPPTMPTLIWPPGPSLIDFVTTVGFVGPAHQHQAAALSFPSHTSSFLGPLQSQSGTFHFQSTPNSITHIDHSWRGDLLAFPFPKVVYLEGFAGFSFNNASMFGKCFESFVGVASIIIKPEPVRPRLM